MHGDATASCTCDHGEDIPRSSQECAPLRIGHGAYLSEEAKSRIYIVFVQTLLLVQALREFRSPLARKYML